METWQVVVVSFASLVAVTFIGIAARNVAELVWVGATLILRGVYWLLVGWWVDRLRRQMLY